MVEEQRPKRFFFKFAIANILLFTSFGVSLFASFWRNMREGNDFRPFMLAPSV